MLHSVTPLKTNEVILLPVYLGWNWQEQRVVIVVQVAEDDIERMVEPLQVGDTTLQVRVEERIPSCHKCGLKFHIRAVSSTACER